MIDWLTRNFDIGNNYIILQQHSEELNTLLADRLVAPFHIGRKHNLWGELAQQLPAIGRRLGWVPNQIPALFLNRTVQEEIADAAAAAEQMLQPMSRHFELASQLLANLGVEQMAYRSPLSLSEGETRIAWFLTQWVKSPDYLIIGYLPANLFAPKVIELVDFILDRTNQPPGPKTIILGYQADQIDWCMKLLARSDWHKLDSLPELGASGL